MAPRRPRTTARDRSRRVLSQNFLTDPAAVARLVRAARPGPDDLLLEVGAGRGQLTRPLAARCARLVAYEVDPAAAADLAALAAQLPQVSHRQEDFLAAPPPDEPFSVVGNIPWSLTAAVVRWCLAAPGLRAATLLTQLEYARKRTGDHGRWSRLTVLTWPEHHWRLAGRVPRAAFRPVPGVDGGILRVERRCEPLLPRAALPAYRRMVELGFGGAGGSLAASLRTAHPRGRVDGALRAARLDPATPVGLVWPEQWLVLFRLLHARDPRDRHPAGPPAAPEAHPAVRRGWRAPRAARRGR
ncbi:23S rRNA (adenine-N6)-dimethyltransferase [Micromonospora purpureochromogenes]|uniref:23S rRNA (Adenine-N6)-dimethyltransferase n=1 Tax=Micromonospora purpureochromogenes TaxID=47872 RepID=A0A1C4W6I6_9ACTN|nr:23S rRNA (adenine-N6)-dimethyltransferase [Micromonospora purpureochromogenes]